MRKTYTVTVDYEGYENYADEFPRAIEYGMALLMGDDHRSPSRVTGVTVEEVQSEESE